MLHSEFCTPDQLIVVPPRVAWLTQNDQPTNGWEWVECVHVTFSLNISHAGYVVLPEPDDSHPWNCEGQKLGLSYDMLQDSYRFAAHKRCGQMVSRSFGCSFIRALELTALVVLTFLLLAWLALSRTRTISTSFIPSPILSIDAEQRWAQYSPYRPAEEYMPLPLGCRVSQVSDPMKTFWLS